MTSQTDVPDRTTSPPRQAPSASADDLEVVRLGFGAMRITGPGIWGPPADHDEAIRVLRRTRELGINFIDTADSYGPNVSEELIAEALHPYADDLVIATKAGLTRQGPDSWIAVGRPAYLRQQAELSLRKLKVDRIDLFQLHRIDPDVPDGGPGRRAQGPAGRGQDPAHRPLRGLRRGAAGGPAGGGDRVGAEQVQPRRPRLPGAPRPLHGARHRLHPVAPGGRPRRRRRAAGGRGRTRRHARRRSRWPGCCASRP